MKSRRMLILLLVLLTHSILPANSKEHFADIHFDYAGKPDVLNLDFYRRFEHGNDNSLARIDLKSGQTWNPDRIYFVGKGTYTFLLGGLPDDPKSKKDSSDESAPIASGALAAAISSGGGFHSNISFSVDGQLLYSASGNSPEMNTWRETTNVNVKRVDNYLQIELSD